MREYGQPQVDFASLIDVERLIASHHRGPHDRTDVR